MAMNVHKNLPNDGDAISHLDAFTQITVYPKSSHYHTFGCPAFVLTKGYKQRKDKKREGRLVLRIYMGPYPHHVGSVSLVLNLTIGNSSPQFHAGYDGLFETTR